MYICSMSKTISLHHIVFATKHRHKTIPSSQKQRLFSYIHSIINRRKCYLKQINGISDHVHLLIDLHPKVALADLVMEMKHWSSRMMRESPDFPDFEGWCEGYYAVSLGVDSVDSCRRYIINQEAHHGEDEFLHEMERMAHRNGLRWYPDDWE